EAWHGGAAAGMFSVPYAIQRRPAPSANAREVALPTAMVIDATSSFDTRERSRLPVNPFNGYVDIILNPDGTVLPNVQYSSPSSFNLGASFYHFWLAERQDLAAVPTNNSQTIPVTLDPNNQLLFYLPIAPPGGTNGGLYKGPTLKGAYSLL